MTGKELIKWIRDNNAEDYTVIVAYKSNRSKSDGICNCDEDVYPMIGHLREDRPVYEPFMGKPNAIIL